MSIEDNIFKKSIVDIDKLLKYGFIKENDKYVYSKIILNESFKVIILVDGNKANGKIIELAFNEEYNNFRNEFITGEFVSKVRNEFESILIDIKDNCFKENYFNTVQANRITNLIINKYNNKPEFLWEKDTNTGVFRNSNNKKWYAIIMNVSKSKLDRVMN